MRISIIHYKSLLKFVFLALQKYTKILIHIMYYYYIIITLLLQSQNLSIINNSIFCSACSSLKCVLKLVALTCSFWGLTQRWHQKALYMILIAILYYVTTKIVEKQNKIHSQLFCHSTIAQIGLKIGRQKMQKFSSFYTARSFKLR
jgi:hypothetical protein